MLRGRSGRGSAPRIARHLTFFGDVSAYGLHDEGEKLLTSAIAGKVMGYSSHDDGDRATVGVTESGWSEAKRILAGLKKAHPKDFYHEAATPAEKMPAIEVPPGILPWK